MPEPLGKLAWTRTRFLLLLFLTIGIALMGFQAGRQSVGVPTISQSIVTTSLPSSHHSVQPVRRASDHHPGWSIREIATIPFAELYDVLRSAPHTQLIAWAADLEQMPRGPRQTAAITAYYKSLIQVNPSAAIQAVLQMQNLNMRDLAMDEILRVVPQSTWPELAQMMALLPYPRRDAFRINSLISGWSCVDPVAVSHFIEAQPAKGADDRMRLLIANWAKIDLTAAKDWMEADVSRQTADVLQYLLPEWAVVDRVGAIDYAVANSNRANFKEAVNGLASYLAYVSPADATALVRLLPPDQAKAAIKAIARDATAIILGAGPVNKQYSETVARWMITLPPELWKEGIGEVVVGWMRDDDQKAKDWLNQLPFPMHDVAIAKFCDSARSEMINPKKVIEAGLTIADRALRDKVLAEFARSCWETRDEAAQEVDQLPISPQQKSYLLKIMWEVPPVR